MLSLAIVLLVGIASMYIWSNKQMATTGQKNQVVRFAEITELESENELDKTAHSYSREYNWFVNSSDCLKLSMIVAIWLQGIGPP